MWWSPDPLRPGNELAYHPGEANLRMADVVVINKVDTADLAAIEQLRSHVRAANPNARIVEAASPITSDRLELIAGGNVLVVEDGPTLTHGQMRFGAGTGLTRKLGAAEIVDPRRASASQLGSWVARGASPFIGSHNSQSSQLASVTPRRVPGSRTQTNRSSG